MLYSEPEEVRLLPLDGPLLEQLVHAATTDARADEVTAPIAPGADWSAARITWLRSYHRDRRSGLDGPEGEATWAIVIGQAVAGSVRLKKTAVPDVLETGMWLARSFRGQGAARTALTAVLSLAAGRGYATVTAETDAGNQAALGTLRSI